MNNGCTDCPKPTKNIKLQQAIDDAKKFAITNGLEVVAILERANGTGFIICSDTDERINRLKVVQYLSFR